MKEKGRISVNEQTKVLERSFIYILKVPIFMNVCRKGFFVFFLRGSTVVRVL